MKCICPMSGVQECPSTCTPAARAKYRKKLACDYYKSGMTQEAIAVELGVSQNTISLDLESLSKIDKLPDRGEESFELASKLPDRTSKRGRVNEGRPRGSKKPRLNESAAAEAAARLILNGESYVEVQKKTGISNTPLRSAVAREEGRREPHFTRADLSMSAQGKYDAAIRQHIRQLDAKFRETVRVEVVRVCDEVQFPYWVERLTKIYDDIINVRTMRKGLMTRAEYEQIRSCLHLDSRRSTSDEKLNDAFRRFTDLKLLLVSEKEAPTPFMDAMPKTLAEWQARKEQVTNKNRQRRTQMVKHA